MYALCVVDAVDEVFIDILHLLPLLGDDVFLDFNFVFLRFYLVALSQNFGLLLIEHFVFEH